MLDEKLSALIDDELDTAEAESVLSQLGADAAVRQAWSRQHLLRAVMKDQVTAQTSGDFADQVMLAIREEEMPASTKKLIQFPSLNWRRNQWTAGLAMAASVGAVAFVLSFNFTNPGSPALVAGDSATLPNTVTTRRVALQQRPQANAEARRELQQHLLDHEALVSGHGLNSQRRYMRMASPSTTYVAYSPDK